MTDPTRDDLRKLRDRLTVSWWNPNWDEWEDTRPATDDEFAAIARAEGWVKLDGIVVEALRRGSLAFRRNDDTIAALSWAPAVLRLLAALDQEASDG